MSLRHAPRGTYREPTLAAVLPRPPPHPLHVMDWRGTLPWASGTLVQGTITRLDPGKGRPATVVQVHGHRFRRGGRTRAWWIHSDGSAELVGEGTVDSHGACLLAFRVPEARPGDYVVEVSDGAHVAFAVFRCRG